MASKTKSILNIKCSLQPSSFNTPPQEQGRAGANAIIAPVYMTKMIMIKKELYSPYILVAGMNSNAAMISSVTGTAHATSFA